MNSLDKNYLSLQFREKIYSKNGTEFQNFFENIMEKAYPSFKRVPSGGGDGGNDGWIKELGRYYQVYAPNTPATKDSDASKKFVNNFGKLKKNWDEISEIKEYYFVFNDKYFGSKEPEKAIPELEKQNPDIKFFIFLAKDLETIFFQLSESDILNLSFNIDHRQAISNAYLYLENIKTELDRENRQLVQKLLEISKDIILQLNDENLSLDYEILECRFIHKVERTNDAKRKYENLSMRYPDDPRPLLYLAEIYLNEKKIDENEKLLEKAKKIDDSFWLLKLNELIRKDHIGEKIETSNIDEKTFPDDPKIKANFYRLYALFFEDSKDLINADSFIEKAIHLNPNRFNNHVVKLRLMQNKVFSNQDYSQILHESQQLLENVEEVERKFSEYGDMGERNKAVLNLIKLNIFRVQGNFTEIERISQVTFKQSISCSFDIQIEQIITGLLNFVSLPNNELDNLLQYLEKSQIKLSEELLKMLIFQFNIKDILFTKGKGFFNKISNEKYLNFINDLERKNYDNVLAFLNNDIQFALVNADTLKNLPDIRKKIIENLPDDKKILKEKLLLSLYFDENDFDKAFEILKQLDLTQLSYNECIPILRIIQKKEAWDYEIIILNNLLKRENKEKNMRYLKSQLFNSYIALKKYAEAVEIGEQLLKQDSMENFLNSKNREIFLINTIYACLERGKIDVQYINKSKEILKEYQPIEPSFEFKVGIETETYLSNNEFEKALESLIDGVKIKKVLSSTEYAKLYYILSIRIGNPLNMKLESQNEVKENTFVKLKNTDQWYFIGNENELDAIKLKITDNKFSLFINKKIGDEILFESKYSSEERKEIIEKIFFIEQYVLWKTVQSVQKLSKDGVLEGVLEIEIPQKEGSIDIKNIVKFFEDQHKRTDPFFEMYCKNNVPLSLLAVNEGSLLNAIGRIQQENKGFINFCIGNIKEFNKQKNIAKDIIDKELAFYLDGTSAFILSDVGLLKKVYMYLPNLKVPQSVISSLIDIADKFSYIPGQTGYMRYGQGEITFSPVEKNQRDLIKSNFFESIKLLELKPENISVISSANKVDCFSERKVPAELSDACILAQKEKIPVLTEDFLYLQMNELETKKKSPNYYSSLALMRVLYDNGKISFDEYLNFFYFLSSYRFRFLSISSNDIEKAVFGDKKLKTINPENIRKLNFQLTLSEEYGVQFQTAFSVVRDFLIKVLIDNTITSDIAVKILIEIIESFPSKMNKKSFGQLLLDVCQKIIENDNSKLIFSPKSPLIDEKIDTLLNATKLFNN